MNDRNEATPDVVGHGEGHQKLNFHPQTIPSSQRRSNKLEAPFSEATDRMANNARRALSAAALCADEPDTLRLLEQVPCGAWLCDYFINQKAKAAIRALRRGRSHGAASILQTHFTDNVYPHDLPRFCTILTRIYWEARQ